MIILDSRIPDLDFGRPHNTEMRQFNEYGVKSIITASHHHV